MFVTWPKIKFSMKQTYTASVRKRIAKSVFRHHNLMSHCKHLLKEFYNFQEKLARKILQL